MTYLLILLGLLAFTLFLAYLKGYSTTGLYTYREVWDNTNKVEALCADGRSPTWTERILTYDPAYGFDTFHHAPRKLIKE